MRESRCQPSHLQLELHASVIPACAAAVKSFGCPIGEQIRRELPENTMQLKETHLRQKQPNRQASPPRAEIV
jgi:hypothetical protein